MMTAEKLDQADALQGQYGKSESINQLISLPANERVFDRREHFGYFYSNFVGFELIIRIHVLI